MSEGAREGPFVISLDIGTSRIKGALVGRELSPFEDPVVRSTPSDPDGLVEAVAEVLDILVSSCPRPPSAVAISCYWHGLLLVDRQSRPLGAITTWQDTRDGQGAQRLREIMDPAQYHAKTGCFIHPSYPMTRIFMSRFAAVSGDAGRMVGPAEWIIMEFFGECVTSASMASGTGLTRIGGDEYDPEVLDAAGVGYAELPRLSESPLTG
ncbi:MAG TPA: FGGY family carbohydrate kinase, partial [Actinomycetota bacterium]|nr:FGGY family carbohydrate kinase [Actinomycetota bacterium]